MRLPPVDFDKGVPLHDFEQAVRDDLRSRRASRLAVVAGTLAMVIAILMLS